MAKKPPVAPKAPAGAPDTPPATASAPAPEQTQEHAGAGETQAPAAAPNAPKKTDPVSGLRISAKREGFRRAGRAWSKQPTEIPLAGMSKADVAALKAEPMLTVEEIELP